MVAAVRVATSSGNAGLRNDFANFVFIDSQYSSGYEGLGGPVGGYFFCLKKLLLGNKRSLHRT